MKAIESPPTPQKKMEIESALNFHLYLYEYLLHILSVSIAQRVMSLRSPP